MDFCDALWLNRSEAMQPFLARISSQGRLWCHFHYGGDKNKTAPGYHLPLDIIWRYYVTRSFWLPSLNYEVRPYNVKWQCLVPIEKIYWGGVKLFLLCHILLRLSPGDPHAIFMIFLALSSASTWERLMENGGHNYFGFYLSPSALET